MSGEGQGSYDDEAGDMGYRRHMELLDEERVGYLEVCGGTCFVDVSLAPTLPKPVQGHLNPGLARGVAFRSDALHDQC